MEQTIIEDNGYKIEYNPDTVNCKFEGSLRLGGPQEYKPITDLLNNILAESPDMITLDLQALNFLNSSGISMLSKFVIGVRKAKTVRVTVLGSNDLPWQGKSLKNLQKLLPSLKLQLN
jgi:hypothetical protein